MRAGTGSASASGPNGLLEREREVEAIAALIEHAAAGEGRVAIVEGPAGIGKTRLVAEARRRAAEAGLHVLAARGGELERAFAFGVVRQLFEPAVLGRRAARLFDGAAAPARAVLEAWQPAAPAEPDASFAVLHGLYWLTANLCSERPLVLAVDDLQWVDRPSLRFLSYLARRLDGLPLLVIGSLRPSEPGLDGEILAELLAGPQTLPLRPAALSEAGVLELVRRRLGDDADPAFAAACASAAGGNPLLTGELLKALEAEGVAPSAANLGAIADLAALAASRSVLLRLARAGAGATAAARALAILGDGADLWTLGALASLDEQRAATAVDDLTRAEILRPEPPLGFVHPLVAAAVYRDVPPGERALGHAAAARLLGDAGAAPERVAAHLLAVPPRNDPAAVATLRRAASVALARGAAESAAAYLRRALAEPPPVERAAVLLELGRAETLTDGPAAAEHLGEALAALTDPVERAPVARLLGRALLFVGRPDDAAAVLRAAALELAPEHGERAALEASALAAELYGSALDFGRVADRLPGVFRASLGRPSGDSGASFGRPKDADWPATGNGALLEALAALAAAHRCDPADGAVRLATAALADGSLLATDLGGVPWTAAVLVLALADREEALTELDRALAEAHRRGSVFAVTSVRLWRGYALLRCGELDEARRELDTAAGEARLWGFDPESRAYGRAFLGATLLERGERAAAARLLGDDVAPGVVSDGARFWLNTRLERLVEEGRDEDALQVAATLRDRYGHVLLPAAGHWRSTSARALDRLGRRDEALAAAGEEVELARRWGAPGALGRALRVLGTLEREDGIERLHEAVAVLDGSTARLEQAKANAAFGAALRRARRPTEAREPLRRALELAAVCGAAPLVEWARSELYAAGSRPRTTALRGVESLTSSERRVASLAADGRTNRDIAQALFVTPKTVEVHLTSAYRKLGIRSRRELGEALAGG